MAGNPLRTSNLQTRPAWETCAICPHKVPFKTYNDFLRHLRESHCSQEGGSFVCRYGYNGVCSSLPLEGVSDKDYEDHVLKQHALASTQLPQVRRKEGTPKPRQSLLSDDAWSIHMSCQNLPAVLNDPKRGKQRDFFTKTWGDAFIDVPEIPPSPFLPEITSAHFTSFLKRMSKRHKAALQGGKLNETIPKLHPDIPEVFSAPDFRLSDPEVFNRVFSFQKDQEKESFVRSFSQNSKSLQEKLTFYLDEVEVSLAHHISSKSESFFSAVASHDVLREQLQQSLTALKALRLKVKEIDDCLVTKSLKVISLETSHQHQLQLLEKLKLMATVHQTQPTIQLLLSSSDYVGALDLIHTTQEILQLELANIHCFKNLGPQLSEMERLIEKMLQAEFHKYITSALNRPWDVEGKLDEEERLVCVVMGMLRQGNHAFLELFREEALTTIKAVMKQTVVEAISRTDLDHTPSNGMGGSGTTLLEQVRLLPYQLWFELLQDSTSALTALLKRAQAIYEVMTYVAYLAAGQNKDAAEAHIALNAEDIFLNETLCSKLHSSLQELLHTICDAAHEKCAKLITARSKDGGLIERLSSSEFLALAQLVDGFASQSEAICGKKNTALRLAFQSQVMVQATRFVQRFHEERRTKLGIMLDSEKWKQAEVPQDLRDMLDNCIRDGEWCFTKRVGTGNVSASPSQSHVILDGNAYVVVGAALYLLPLLLEYGQCLVDLPSAAPDLLTRVVELLKTFNSRCCQLVLGAGALHVAGLKTISSKTLALASRSLQLIQLFIPKLKLHFESKLQAKQLNMSKHFDQLVKDYSDHVAEIELKLVTLLSEMMDGQLGQWEAKPPVPSVPFKAICRQLAKLQEAIGPVLPPSQIQHIIYKFNIHFQLKLGSRLQKLGVPNDGGPQHGLVTSELVFYVQNLKNCKLVSEDMTVEKFSQAVWDVRQK